MPSFLMHKRRKACQLSVDNDLLLTTMQNEFKTIGFLPHGKTQTSGSVYFYQNLSSTAIFSPIMDKWQCNHDNEPLQPELTVQHCKHIEDLLVSIFQLGGQELVHESIDHLITSKSNDSVRRCSQQICSTTSVESSNPLLL